MTMTSTLTHRQQAVLGFIREFHDVHGCAPSYEEIARGIGLKSKSGIHRVIHELQRRGVIRKKAGLRRQYEIVEYDRDKLKTLLRRVYPYLTYDVPIELRQQVRAAL